MAFVRDASHLTPGVGAPESGKTPRAPLARVVFAVLAWGLVAGVVVQIFIAGLATFVDGTRWETHASFVHVFEFVPLVMLVVALAARLPRRFAALSGAIFVLIMLQYVLAQMRTSSIPELAALHVVNAAFIYYGAVTLARGATAGLRWRTAS